MQVQKPYFKAFVNNKHFSDLIIVLRDSSRFNTHTTTLIESSLFLKHEIEKLQTKQALSGSKAALVINIKPKVIDREIMTLILTFLYEGTADDIKEELLPKMLLVADYFKIHRLLSHLKERVCEKNAILLFKTAFHIQNLIFVHHCISVIDFGKLIKSPGELKKLSRGMIINLSKTRSDLKAVQLIMSWSRSFNAKGKLDDRAIERILIILEDFAKRCRVFSSEIDVFHGKLVDAASNTTLKERVNNFFSDFVLEKKDVGIVKK